MSGEGERGQEEIRDRERGKNKENLDFSPQLNFWEVVLVLFSAINATTYICTVSQVDVPLPQNIINNKISYGHDLLKNKIN